MRSFQTPTIPVITLHTVTVTLTAAGNDPRFKNWGKVNFVFWQVGESVWNIFCVVRWRWTTQLGPGGP